MTKEIELVSKFVKEVENIKIKMNDELYYIEVVYFKDENYKLDTIKIENSDGIIIDDYSDENTYDDIIEFLELNDLITY